MLELIRWLEQEEKVQYTTFSRIKNAFAALPVERQRALMDGRRSDPLKTFNFIIRKRNSSFGSLSDMVRKFGSLSREQEDAIDREDRSFPTTNE